MTMGLFGRVLGSSKDKDQNKGDRAAEGRSKQPPINQARPSKPPQQGQLAKKTSEFGEDPKRGAPRSGNSNLPATLKADDLPQEKSSSSKAGGLIANAIEPDENELAFIESYTGEVVTAPGGLLDISNPQQRKFVAILGDGTLLFDKSNPLNAHIMSVRTLAERNNVTIHKEFMVDLATIRKVYENFERLGSGRSLVRSDNKQKRQKEFLDLIGEAVKSGASDVHISVMRHEAIIRFRADGVMRQIKQINAADAADLCQAAFNMADASDANYKPMEYQGARISETQTDLPHGVQSLRLQFNPLPAGGRLAVIRLLYAQSKASGGDVDSLGYTKKHLEMIKIMRRKSVGINVISGPTGSGKSTTLQRCLTTQMKERKGEIAVITIEDPPEYVIPGASQLPVANADTAQERNEKFRAAIAASLRSDPDIIMIGEVRDGASAGLAFAAAMTGHQVWCSLHANDAVSILDRFRDMGVEPYKLCDHTLITGLVGQRLVRRLCDNCKVSVKEAQEKGWIDPDLAEGVYRIFGPDGGPVRYAREGGCPECRNGYKGRAVVAEICVPDSKFMSLFREGDKAGAIHHWQNHLEGVTLLEHGIQKLAAGLTAPNDVEEKIGLLTEFDLDRIGPVLKDYGLF
jgi:general secretion pathway protein E